MLAAVSPGEDLLGVAARARRAGWGRGWGQLGTPEEALLEGREAACLADEDVGNLAHLDADEEHGVTGV